MRDMTLLPVENRRLSCQICIVAGCLHLRMCMACACACAWAYAQCACKQVHGDKAEVDGDKAEVHGDKAEVDGDKAEVDGDKAEVDGDKAEVDGDKAEVCKPSDAAAPDNGGSGTHRRLAQGNSIAPEMTR
jgi:hypothetical protein